MSRAVRASVFWVNTNAEDGVLDPGSLVFG